MHSRKSTFITFIHRAENRTRAALPTELRRTLLNHAAQCWATRHPDRATPHPNWATLHPNWGRPHPDWVTLHFDWATPHPAELRRTLLSYANPCLSYTATNFVTGNNDVGDILWLLHMWTRNDFRKFPKGSSNISQSCTFGPTWSMNNFEHTVFRNWITPQISLITSLVNPYDHILPILLYKNSGEHKARYAYIKPDFQVPLRGVKTNRVYVRYSIQCALCIHVVRTNTTRTCYIPVAKGLRVFRICSSIPLRWRQRM
jgi:hypothetical protein